MEIIELSSIPSVLRPYTYSKAFTTNNGQYIKAARSCFLTPASRSILRLPRCCQSSLLLLGKVCTLRWGNVKWDRTKCTLQSVILTVLHIIAIGSTIFRLIHRFRIKKIGWDDYAAVIAVSFNISVLVQLWFKFHDKCAYQFFFKPLFVNLSFSWRT